MLQRSILVLLLLLLTASTPASQKRGLQVAQTVYDSDTGFKGETIDATLTITNARGQDTVRKMSVRVLELAGDGRRSMIEFHSPPDVKGTRLLTWSHRKGRDEQWLYLPALRRVKRVSAHNKSGSFMGSEFAYEDLISDEVEKYTYHYIGEEALAGRAAWKVERYPVDKQSGYSKGVVWYDQEYKRAVRIDLYDRKGSHLKTASFSNYKKHGRWWRPTEIRMQNLQTRKSSTMRWTNHKLGVALDVGDFASGSLQDNF